MSRRLLALGRLKTGTMNKTEARYAAYLGELVAGEKVAWWKFEAVKLRLADNTFYSPDFAVMLTNGILEMHEVKSIWLGDARAKIKIASEMFPFRFVAVYAIPQRDGGGWKIETFDREAA